MSDTSLPTYIHYGTAAQRAAFTPSPPATGQPIYLWYETDTGDFYLYDTTWHLISGSASAGPRTFGITIGDGSSISTGVAGFVRIPFSGTITKATALSIDPSATAGSIVVDVWVDTFANYPPTNADSITAAAPITLSAANKSEDTTLTGWTTAITAGTVAGFNVDSVSGLTLVLIMLEVS